MSIALYIIAGVSGLAAIQERKDFMRCGGCVLLAVIAVVAGYVAGHITELTR